MTVNFDACLRWGGYAAEDQNGNQGNQVFSVFCLHDLSNLRRREPRHYSPNWSRNNTMMPMFDVQGFILVGGASSRMGTDKARLTFGDLTAVELIGKKLQAITNTIAIVGGRDERFATFPNIPDLRKDWGPLAGIEAALRHAGAGQCLIVGCDFPFVTTKLFEHLLLITNDADAVVPIQDDGRAQPLCAVYRARPCLPASAAAIAAGQHSPRALLDRVRTHYVPFSEISHLEGAGHFFFNVNTPENYQRAKEIFQQADLRS